MSRLKKEILGKLKEYAGKMGRDHLGGDDIASPKRGGLRDFDGYDNVQYNKDMPMDEMQVVNKKTGKDITKHVLALLSGKIDKKKFEKLTGLKKESVTEAITPPNSKKVEALKKAVQKINRKYKVQVSKIGPTKGEVEIELGSGNHPDNDYNTIDKLVKKLGIKHYSVFNEGIVNEACWDTYKQVGMKTKGGKQVPNCVPESISEGMFSAIDQIKQDSKDVRDFVKNVFKDREFKKMSNDKDFIKYLKSIYEGVDEGGMPQNFHQGRTSDYHTALRGKNRDYSGGTNFKKTNHGQPDVEEDDEDQETNHLSNKQTHIKSKLKVAESGKKKSDKNYKDWKSSRLRKEISKKLKEYGQRLDLSFIEDEEAKLDGTYPPTDAIDKDIDETAKRDYKDEYKKFQSSKKSKKYRAELNKYNRDKGTYGNGDGKDASHKGGKIVGFESESKNRGRAEKSRLKKESVNEGNVDRVVGHTKYKYVGDGRKGKAIVSGPMKDREKEAIIKRAKKAGYNAKPNMGGGVTIHVESLEVNEIGQFPINNYIQGIIPNGYLDTHTPQKKKQSVKLVSDLKKTLNNFWKSHDIPYRIK